MVVCRGQGPGGRVQEAEPEESLQPPRRLASTVEGNGVHRVVMGTDPCPSSGPSGDIHRARTQSPGSGWAQQGQLWVSCGKNVRITFLSEKQGLQQQRGDPPGGRACYGLGATLQAPAGSICWWGPLQRRLERVPGATAPGPGPPRFLTKAWSLLLMGLRPLQRKTITNAWAS